MKDATYEKWMRIGRSSGCHQMPERSFFINGKQFPVCARCTGVIVGQTLAYLSFLLYAPGFSVCVLGCGIMFLDWLAQYMEILRSTNGRRLVTGIVGGYSLAAIYCKILKYGILFLCDICADIFCPK